MSWDPSVVQGTGSAGGGGQPSNPDGAKLYFWVHPPIDINVPTFDVGLFDVIKIRRLMKLLETLQKDLRETCPPTQTAAGGAAALAACQRAFYNKNMDRITEIAKLGLRLLHSVWPDHPTLPWNPFAILMNLSAWTDGFGLIGLPRGPGFTPFPLPKDVLGTQPDKLCFTIKPGGARGYGLPQGGAVTIPGSTPGTSGPRIIVKSKNLGRGDRGKPQIKLRSSDPNYYIEVIGSGGAWLYESTTIAVVAGIASAAGYPIDRPAFPRISF